MTPAQLELSREKGKVNRGLKKTLIIPADGKQEFIDSLHQRTTEDRENGLSRHESRVPCPIHVEVAS